MALEYSLLGGKRKYKKTHKYKNSKKNKTKGKNKKRTKTRRKMSGGWGNSA